LNRRILITERLRLAPITVADSDRLALLHADARVMNLLKHGVLSRQQSDAMVAAYEAEWSTLGFGSWTVTERSGDAFVGLVGLRMDHGGVALRLAFVPQAQGKGYGPECGRAILAFAFDVAGLDKIVAITRLDNIPGQRGLEKFGMRRERQWTQEDGRALVLYVAAKPEAE
jgi:RimJ/RimL family protein N-acetyltransferase